MKTRLLLPALAGGLVGLGAGFGIGLADSPLYRASSVVAAEHPGGPRPGAGLVREALLAPSVLEEGLVASEASTPFPQGLTREVKERLEVREREPGTFEVAFAHADAAVAHGVVSGLVSRLAEGAGETPADPRGPTPNDAEIAEVKDRIDELAARIARGGGESPGARLLAELRELRGDLRDRDAAVREADSRVRALLEPVEEPPPPPASSAAPSPIDELRAELAVLRTRYTDEHPDVRSLLIRIRELEAEAARGEPAPAPTPDEGELRAARSALDEAREARQEALASVARTEAELARAGRVEAATTNRISEHRRLQERYVELLAQRAGTPEASGATGVPIRFRVVSRARWPREASSSSPSLFGGLGLTGGLLLGILFGLVRERTDDRIRTSSEVEELVRAPQLAEIPEVRVSRRERERRRRARG